MRARCSNQLAAAMCLLVPLAAGFLLPAPRVPISGGGGCALSGCSGGMVGGPVLAIKQHRGLRGLCTLLSMSGGRDGAIRSASNRVKSALSRAAAGWGGNEALLVSVVDDLAVPILRRADRNAGEEQLILMLTSELEHKLIDEMGILSMQQFQAFEKALESVGPGGDDGIWDGEEEDDDEGFDGHASHSEEAPAASGGGEGGSDGEEGSLAEELDLFTKKLSSYIQRTRLDEDDVSELRALTMMTGRSMQRRADGGMYDNGGVREALRGQLFAQIVEREGLVSEEDWAAIITSKVSPLSSSKPQGGAAKTAAANPAALLLELKGMFPGAPPSMLLSAAKGAKSLDEAVAKLSAPAPPSGGKMLSAGGLQSEHVERAHAELSGAQVLRTMPVNSGSSAFGIYFDLVSRGDRELLVTGIRAASSAGLNDNVVAGKKMDGKAAISVRVYSCTSGSGKGKEDVEGEWELLGEDKTVSLPVVSWADPFAGYGILPQLRPIRVPPGGTVGVCVRTDKVSGLATMMQPGRGGDCDMMDEDFGGKADQDDVAGVPKRSFYPGAVTARDSNIEVRCGFTAVAPAWGPQDGVLPVVAAFVGEIEYELA